MIWFLLIKMLAVLVPVFKNVFKYLRNFFNFLFTYLWKEKKNILIKVDKTEEAIKYLKIINANPNRYKSLISCTVSIEFNNYFHDLFKKEFKLHQANFINQIVRTQFEKYQINEFKKLDDLIFVTGNVYLTKCLGYRQHLIEYTLLAYQKLDDIFPQFNIENILFKPDINLKENIRQLYEHLKHLFSNRLQLHLASYLIINLKIVQTMLNNLIVHLLENKKDLEEIELEIYKETRGEGFIELNEYWKFKSTRLIIQKVIVNNLGFDLYQVKQTSPKNLYIAILNIKELNKNFMCNFYLNDFDSFFFTFLTCLIVNLIRFYRFEKDNETLKADQQFKWYQTPILNESKFKNYKLIKRFH